MKIHVRHQPVDEYAGQIVAAALVRSFTATQVAVDVGEEIGERACEVWINPPAEAAVEIAECLGSGGKAIVFGRLESHVAEALSLDLKSNIDLPLEWAACAFGVPTHHDTSPAVIRYDPSHSLGRLSPLIERPLCRFDFVDEWNNQGFGRIALDCGPWSIQTAAQIGDATMLAELHTPDGRSLVYVALRDTPRGAALWFNRPVGPVDSLEWSMIESFLADYRADELPCFPCVSEIPAGYSGAACPRLDCDEAVASARPLWDLYSSYGLPLSLAIPTGLRICNEDFQFVREVIAAGGSVLSHSIHHLPNWGGTYERACAEAAGSQSWFHEHFHEASRVRYAVSPFHQNPQYAVRALADCRYDGFVSGIIASDPEYLLGRAGRVPFAPRPIVSLSAQCMLHGDCYRRYGNSIDAYQQSFDNHHTARAAFGYLDHPFSDRYQYGWEEEKTRIDAHRQLIEHIGRSDGIWWAGLSGVLDFLRHRDAVRTTSDGGNTLRVEMSDDASQPPLAIHWKGRHFAY